MLFILEHRVRGVIMTMVMRQNTMSTRGRSLRSEAKNVGRSPWPDSVVHLA